MFSSCTSVFLSISSVFFNRVFPVFFLIIFADDMRIIIIRACVQRVEKHVLEVSHAENDHSPN